VIDAILRHFPPHTHPLVLVGDRDGLLADEEILAALAERGFKLIAEPDPVRLRYRVEEARPFSAESPTIVVTAGPLNELPYDLWQQGHHVVLDLHAFYPNLAYPVVRTLAPSQRWKLSQVPSPPRRLGRRGTVAFVLRHVFAADPDALRQPARLVAWLNGYHRQADPMPPALAGHLLAHLQKTPAYAGWPLNELLASRDVFATFVREQWRACVQQQSGQLLGERAVRYLLRFEADGALQDILPALVRSGTLQPLAVDRPDRLPGWARPAVLASGEDRRARRTAELFESLVESVEASLSTARWEEWQAVARAWAELTALAHHPDRSLDPAQQKAYAQIQARLDGAFLGWLRQRYAPLGSQRLPRPHHLYHVPHYMAYQRRQGQADRVALLILDGMALADWTLIGSTWRARHPGWQFQERLLLAQVPTITSVSRQALVSGLRPAEFAGTLHTTGGEAGRWAGFWAGENLPSSGCPCAHMALDRDSPPPEVDSARTRALCLIDTRIDDMIHDATLGSTDLAASLRLWLEGYGQRVEEVIAGLLARGFAVYLASDHGHVEARGFGRPSEGLTVDTRGQRARIYSDRHAALHARQGFEAILWERDGLLPDGVYALMPKGRNAFDTFDKRVVTHGGPTVDEVIVPLVTIALEK
jgi:hypothetical protein